MTCFDSYARDYDAALNRGLIVSGEDKNFFAEGRIEWLSLCLERLNFRPQFVLDYGCGTGSATPFLIGTLGARRVLGLDLSEKSLEVARATHVGLSAEYRLASEYVPNQSIDLAFCNGVFHHVPRAGRHEITSYIARCLRPGGMFALWENNPWNPGTQWIMKRIPFDKDAVMLFAREARSLVDAAGMAVVQTDYCFIFPRVLKALRRIEKHVTQLPIGAQYQVLARKGPASP